jgi:hypothetical protein
METDARHASDGPKGGEEGRFAATWQNKAAGRALRAARLSLDGQESKQTAFASMLSEQLGIPVNPTTLSGWETGRRTVPAPVWMAAAMAAQQSIDALLGETAMPEVVPWVEALGMPKRLDSQAAEIEGLKGELEQMRREHAAFYTQVVDALARAGLPPPSHAPASAPSSRPRKRSSSA